MSGTMSGNTDSQQQYCLRWNNHRTNLLNVFDQLLQTEDFTDVTLAVNGTSIKCHKMVLAACSSYFRSLFLENSCAHPIVVFKDIQYSEIRAILEYMYRGEVSVAQEELPSLLKVAEALRVKGLFEADEPTATTASGDNPSQQSKQEQVPRPPRSTSNSSVNRNVGRTRSPTPTLTTQRSKDVIRPATPSSPSVPRSPQGLDPNNTDTTPGLLFPRHPSYLYKSPLLSPQTDRTPAGGVPLGMWPPLVMPLHLGALESALREREQQALALAGIQQRMKEERDLVGHLGSKGPLGNGAPDADLLRETEAGRSGNVKRKRMASDPGGPLLRTFLGSHLKTPELPGLFPFRMAPEGSLDERGPLHFLPNNERNHSKDRDEDWNQNQDLPTSEEDPIETSGDYSGHTIASSPHSDKRVDSSGGRIVGYVPGQKLEWKRYKQYTTSDISAAIEAVRGGMSALQASRKFKVPSRTLYDKVKKLGIATTRPYSRVSSSASAAAAAALHHQNPSGVLSSYAAQTAAFTSAVAAAASALSLVKQQQQRERGPVIQVAGSSVDDTSEEGSQRVGEGSIPTPPNGTDKSDDHDEPQGNSTSPPELGGRYAVPNRPFISVRDELNRAATLEPEPTSPSPA